MCLHPDTLRVCPSIQYEVVERPRRCSFVASQPCTSGRLSIRGIACGGVQGVTQREGFWLQAKYSSSSYVCEDMCMLAHPHAIICINSYLRGRRGLDEKSPMYRAGSQWRIARKSLSFDVSSIRRRSDEKSTSVFEDTSEIVCPQAAAPTRSVYWMEDPHEQKM